MKKVMINTLAALAIMAGAAHAEEGPEKFYAKTSGLWTVEGFRSQYEFCSASTFWDDGNSFVSVVVYSDDSPPALFVHNERWDLPDNATNNSQVTLQFKKGNESESGKTDYKVKDNKTIIVTGINKQFLSSFIKYSVMSINLDGASTVTLGLKGTGNAVSLLSECMNEFTTPQGGNNNSENNYTGQPL